MHLPLRDKRLAASLRSGGLLAGIVCVLAVPAGLLAASIAGTGHAAVYIVLLASGSAAVLLPALEETGIAGPDVMTLMAQVTIADLITILSVPIKPFATGLVATAQLGVPAAIASLGLSEHVLSASVATAIVVAALVSLGVCTVGVGRLVRLLSPAPSALSARAAS